MTNHRSRIPATVPAAIIETLEGRTYTCWVNRHDTPMLDIYEIRNADGTLRWASKDPGLFETIAEIYTR